MERFHDLYNEDKIFLVSTFLNVEKYSIKIYLFLVNDQNGAKCQFIIKSFS